MKQEYLKEITLLKNSGKYCEAISYANKVLESFKLGEYQLYSEMYDCLNKSNRRKEAVRVLNKMIEIKPCDLSNHKRLAYNHFCLGEYKKALEYYKYIIDVEPLSSTNYFNAASMYDYLKNVNMAILYYNTALKLDPHNLSALNNLGLLYYENKKYNEAFALFKRAIQISCGHPEAYHHLGVYYRDVMKDYELAELYIKKAIRFDKRYSDNYYQLGLTYYVQNKFDEAECMFAKCLEINPAHKEAKTCVSKMKKTEG